MSVSAAYALTVSATETFDTTVNGNEAIGSGAAAASVLHNGFNISGTLTSLSTVPATTVCAFTQALTGGTATIDLCALPGTNGNTVSLDGLKVQLMMIKAPAANANTMAIGIHGTEGFPIFGASNEIDLVAGQQVLLFGNDASADVASDSADQLLMTGTGTQELDIIIVAG